jgi:hypothetical protein
MKFQFLQVTLHLRILAVSLSFIAIAAAAPALFVPASPENIRLADGTPLPEDLSSISWQWHPAEIDRGVLKCRAASPQRPKILMVSASQLEAGAIYEVFGYFWADDAVVEGTDSQQHHAVQFGLTLATLHPFDGERPDALVSQEPWIITPGYETGKPFGYEATARKTILSQGWTGCTAPTATPA